MASIKIRLRRLFFILLLCGRIGPAAAESAIACDQSPDCGRQLAEAQNKVAMGALEPALQSLQDLFSKYPDPRLLYSIARLLHRLNRPAEAVPVYRRFLDSAAESDSQVRVKARQQLAEAETEASTPSLLSPPVDNAPPSAEQPPVSEANTEASRPTELPPVEPKGTGLVPESPPKASHPSHRRPWVWGLIGGLAVTTVVGGVFVGLTIAGTPPSDTRDLRWTVTAARR